MYRTNTAKTKFWPPTEKALIYLFPWYASTRFEGFYHQKSTILLKATAAQFSGTAELILWIGLSNSHITPVFTKQFFLHKFIALGFLASEEFKMAFVIV